MNILSIVGPTAVGKSSIAMVLAEQLLAGGKVLDVDIISADSRQVYKGLEILTGADIPEKKEQLFLHGVSVVSPADEWSLAHFHQMAQLVIEAAAKNNRAVLVVGGTGLYQTQLLQSEMHNQSPPSSEVREKAASMSVAELQTWLQQIDEAALANLNESDRANPRRLVRAIERSLWKKSHQEQLAQPSAHTQYFFGLHTNKEDLEHRIKVRVEQRLEQGVVNEVLHLEAQLEESAIALSSLPAHTACGLREVLAYAHGDIDREQCVELWTQRELAYAKRQETWWKKYPAVEWFDITADDWKSDFVTAVLERFYR